MFRRREIWALIAVQFLFASNAVVGRLALATFTPRAILVLRICGAASVFWAFGFRSALRERFTGREVRTLLLCAVLGLVLNQGFYLLGLSLSTATNATIIGTSIPVFTAAISMAVGDERLALGKILGLALALSGALTLAGIDRLLTASADHRAAASLGDLFFVANSLSFSAYFVLVRKLARRHDALAISRWTFAFAALLSLPLAFLGPLTHAATSSLAWAEAVYLVLGPTVLAYLFNAYALRFVDSSTAASFVYLQPVIAAAMALPLLGERPGARTGLGALLIFSGVLLGSSSDWRARRALLAVAADPG